MYGYEGEILTKIAEYTGKWSTWDAFPKKKLISKVKVWIHNKYTKPHLKDYKLIFKESINLENKKEYSKGQPSIHTNISEHIFW